MKKIKKSVAFLLASALLLGGCAQPEEPAAGGEISEISAVSQENLEPSEVPEPLADIYVSFAAAGDNLIHDVIYQQAAQRAGNNGYDFAYPYKQVRPLIEEADLAFLNQETVLASAIFPPSTYPCFNSPTQLGNEMLNIGFDVFSHANNHVLDKGVKGVLATLDYWAQHPQALVVGAYRNQQDLDSVKSIQRGGLTFSFIGITEHTNGINLPQNTEVKLIYADNEELIQQQIEKARKVSDVVVVSAHWGTEDTHIVTPRQKELAQKMADWGADVILGQHPHVLQPIELLQKADGGQCLTIYSLGNFISCQWKAANMIGGVLTFDVVKSGKSGHISFENILFKPTITHYEYGEKNIRIIPFSEYTASLASSHGVRRHDSSFQYSFIQKTLEKVIGKKYLGENEAQQQSA